METYNYWTYCESCQTQNIIQIPKEFDRRPIDFLESTEVNCEKCKERILI